MQIYTRRNKCKLVQIQYHCLHLHGHCLAAPAASIETQVLEALYSPGMRRRRGEHKMSLNSLHMVVRAAILQLRASLILVTNRVKDDSYHTRSEYIN